MTRRRLTRGGRPGRATESRAYKKKLNDLEMFTPKKDLRLWGKMTAYKKENWNFYHLLTKVNSRDTNTFL